MVLEKTLESPLDCKDKVREEFNSGRWGEKMHEGGREMSRQGGGSRRRRLGQKKVP